MTRLHQHRIGRRAAATLSAGVVLLAAAAIAPVSANAAACTKTISGAHTGVLTVAGKQKLCLRTAVQNGAVNVAPGGGLSVIGSTITGAVTLKSGYSELRFCGSKTVRGAISATGGMTAVLIGGAAGCAANTIGGAVTLNANKAGVTLGGNSIAGAVTASANLVGTTISANAIRGALTCTTNAPDPTNGGVKNTVGGGRSGQTCAVLTF
jgi:hexosaminidase